MRQMKLSAKCEERQFQVTLSKESVESFGTGGNSMYFASLLICR
jgi:hypothetical protein